MSMVGAFCFPVSLSVELPVRVPRLSSDLLVLVRLDFEPHTLGLASYCFLLLRYWGLSHVHAILDIPALR